MKKRQRGTIVISGKSRFISENVYFEIVYEGTYKSLPSEQIL